MRTKFYVKLKNLYVLINAHTGRRSYTVWEDARDYEKMRDADQYPMVYDTLKDARTAVAVQFIEPCHTEFPDGLGIEKVEFKWFGLRKKRTMLPVIGSNN